MKPFYIAAVVCALGWAPCGRASQVSAPLGDVVSEGGSVGRAFKDRASRVQVEGEGVVSHVLADDLDGGRHQRFIVRLASGQTVLVAHNIDIAPRVAGLQGGDSLRFSGEYVWSAKGGTVHWTHRDPRGRHAAGWIKHGGRIYQ